MIELPDLADYRPNVGICVLNRRGEVWLGERLSPPKSQEQTTYRWQMPQGGMDKGESAAETARRELWEETGIRSARLLCLTPGWLVYDFPEEYRMRKKDKWRGQRQRWALMVFDGDDREIDLAAHDPQEFSAWRWASMDEVPGLVVPFKRGVYRTLMESFRPMASYIADQYR